MKQNKEGDFVEDVSDKNGLSIFQNEMFTLYLVNQDAFYFLKNLILYYVNENKRSD